MERRDFLRGAAGAAAGGLILTRWPDAAASPRATASPGSASLTLTPLGERLFLIRGGGGNVTVFDSPDGVLLVDGGSPQRSHDVMSLVHSRTGRSRVAVLFNTHWHWDQTGSNRTLGPAGTRIISHENTRLWLGTVVNEQWQHRIYEPLPRPARPNQTFYTSGSLDFGGETIEYGYLARAHTDGDIYVHFRKADVLVAGDVVSVGTYPIIDYSTDGWIGGLANAAQTLLKRCATGTRVIPGTGPAQSRADLDREHTMLNAVKLELSRMLAKGMSVQEMLAAGATKAFDANWGDPTLFVSNAYPGLVKHAYELGVHIV
jgi:glyoxylase-like metal-dependent hydrolase (beta-lactamase superfamily II)